MRKNFVWLTGIMIALAGCVSSLYPLYTAKDLTFEADLLGTWINDRSDEKWTFTQSDEKKYLLVLRDNEGKEGSFDAHLVKVKDRLYLDLFPADPEQIRKKFYSLNMIPVHTFYLVKSMNPTLKIAPLNMGWLEDYLALNTDAIKHVKREDEIILTAKPEELQAFLIAHEKTPDAFADFSNMEKEVE